MNVILCEDSMAGIFTAIYESYEWKLDPKETELQISSDEDRKLFAEYFVSHPSTEKMKKVSNTLQRDFGQQFFKDVAYTLSSKNKEKAQAVYQTIALGLTLEKKSSVIEYLSNPWVLMMFRLSRNAMREEDHLRGFLRFEELENGILFSRIGPENDVIGFLAQHFSDRFPMEDFMIFDDQRNYFVIHPKGKPWYFVHDVEDFDDSVYIRSEQEKQYSELFKAFCQHISIRERQNPKLQQNMLPLRFREYMTEFR